MSDIMINIGLYVTYALCIIALLAAMVFPLYFIIKNFRKAKTSLLGAGVILLIFAVSYLISSSDVLPKFAAFGITPQGSKLIGAGFITLYLFGFISLLMLVFTEVKVLFK